MGLSCFLFSCQKINEKAVILLSPFDLYIQAAPQEVVLIDITCNSPFELKRFIIKSRIEGGFSHTELDTIISGKDYYLPFEYQVPEITDTADITLEFNLFDASNEKVINFRVIQVLPSYVFLTETAGHVIYSGNSELQNGYNLLTGERQFLHLVDSSQVHIADTSNNETLLKRWVSPAAVKFVKFNDFDYANCTNLTAKEAYNSGVKFDFLNNIAEGDIYICKIRTPDLKESYPVIRIVDIFDESGSESDRYVFNIKK
jgi:hypothetical protein